MNTLSVQVTDDFRLDGGQYTIQEHPDRIDYVITPPATPMLDQLIAYLERQPYQADSAQALASQSVGLAALAIRWGTYLACLCEPAFPLYAPEQFNFPEAEGKKISRVMNTEMRRLNIEVSANLARLGRMCREEKSRFHDLLWRAYEYLPMPQKLAAPDHDLRAVLTSTYLAGSLKLLAIDDPAAHRAAVRALGLTVPERSREERMRTIQELPGDPDRVIANQLAARGWRNSLIEEYHRGIHLSVDAPLLPAQRRFTRRDEGKLMKVMSSSAYEFLRIYPELFDPSFRFLNPDSQLGARYPNSALAIYNAGAFSFYPTNWSFTDTSAEITLRHYRAKTAAVSDTGD